MKCVIDAIRRQVRQARLSRASDVSITGPIELSYPERIQLGSGCHISQGAVLRANGPDTAIKLGDRVSIHEYALLAANEGQIEIGSRSWIAPYCLIYGNGGVTLGSNVLLGPRVSINTVGHQFDDLSQPINDQPLTKDPVVIEDNVWIGMHAVILQGVRIGTGAVVAAGAVVTQDVPANTVVAGVPARVVRERTARSAPAETLPCRGVA